MKKILFSMLVCLLCTGVQAQKMAKISATATGYSGKMCIRDSTPCGK